MFVMYLVKYLVQYFVKYLVKYLGPYNGRSSMVRRRAYLVSSRSVALGTSAKGQGVGNF